MPSIVGKRRGNQTYYYLVESARVDGKPRIVSQQYLGPAAEVIAKLTGSSAGVPVRSQHKRFGDVAAVWSVLTDLDVVGLVDDVVARHAHAGASVGSRSSRTPTPAPAPTSPSAAPCWTSWSPATGCWSTVWSR